MTGFRLNGNVTNIAVIAMLLCSALAKPALAAGNEKSALAAEYSSVANQCTICHNKLEGKQKVHDVSLAGMDTSAGSVLPVAGGEHYCEGCHGSTHAIWPNALASANDNVAAIQLQGHAGTITECSTCHTSLPLTLGGPHGMHNVNSAGWNTEHEDFYEDNPKACQACHGRNLEGTVLSRTAADRDYLRDEDDDDDDEGGGGQTIHLVKGTPVSCDMCHEKP